MTAARAEAIPALPRRSATPAVKEALCGAVLSEVRLLEDLVDVLRKQRDSVGADDLEGVDDSVFATHRILVTLGEARRQRRSLTRMVTGTNDIGLSALDNILGDEINDEVRDARERLQAAALTLSREVEINRKVLRSALNVSGDVIRGLCGPEEEPGTYVAESKPKGRRESGGYLIDRQA